MEDIFITKIKINEVRNVRDVGIDLSETERKHLIITGKNGSGKTSLLEDLSHRINPKSIYLSNSSKVLFNYRPDFIDEHPLEKVFNKGEFIIKYFGAKRASDFIETKGVSKIEFKRQYQINENFGNEFTQHIVNLQFDKLYAKNENDLETANRIDKWFEDFEKKLAELFDEPKFKLTFDIKNYSYQIVENGNPPYTFNQLPDGYSAILDIVTELIMRMEEHKGKSYDVQGIVLIDEIETHLHIDLQKKILPFLTSFFPKIQFIVTTHSPFVLNSIENAVICDLEKRIVTEDLSDYSYDTIVESYFRNDKYSEILKKKVKRYESLLGKKDLSLAETEEFYRLKMELEQAPKFLANELDVKLQQLNLKERTL